jgi:lipid-A-disaccharide synthase
MEYDALQLATAAAVCSGTATLEFACLGVPMVIVYQAGLGTSIQFVLIRGVIGKQWRVGMPNIIAGRDIVPELLWTWKKPEALARELGSLLSDEGRRNQMKSALAEVVASLGDDPRLEGVSASERTAELVLELIGQERAV